jgi:hypothetical protein
MKILYLLKKWRHPETNEKLTQGYIEEIQEELKKSSVLIELMKKHIDCLLIDVDNHIMAEKRLNEPNYLADIAFNVGKKKALSYVKTLLTEQEQEN